MFILTGNKCDNFRCHMTMYYLSNVKISDGKCGPITNPTYYHWYPFILILLPLLQLPFFAKNEIFSDFEKNQMNCFISFKICAGQVSFVVFTFVWTKIIGHLWGNNWGPPDN